MSLLEFHKRLKIYLRTSGRSQKELAHALNLHPDVLSHKLKGMANYSLSNSTVKQIIMLLAEWEVITNKRQVLDLLQMMDLSEHTFKSVEWNKRPLSQLEVEIAPKSRANSTQPGPGSNHVHLPAQLSSFIGREAEIDQLKGLLLSSQVRLVTLTGLGGVGKTRLALEAARQLADYFSDGLFFVALETLNDGSMLADWISQSVGLKQLDQANSLERLTHYLKTKRLLLLLDNFEQLAGTALTLATLLNAAPGLKLLVTSRSLLHLYGEHEVMVAPLELPSQNFETDINLSDLAQSSAFQLFCERAKAANPFFRVTAENARAIAHLCIYLEGLPLALELAAANSKLFSPATLLARLAAEAQKVSYTGTSSEERGDTNYIIAASQTIAAKRGSESQKGVGRLEMQAGTVFGLAPRQQTLRHTLDWSYNLLNPVEQILLERLAIFNDTFTTEAVETICFNRDLPGSAVVHQGGLNLGHLLSLVNHSLVQYFPSPHEHRFGLLAVVREYALERLSQKFEFETLQLQYASFFLSLVEKAEPHLQKADQGWLARLKPEQPNLWAVLDWAQSNNTPVQGEIQLKLVSGLVRFWQLNGQLSEGRRRLEKALGQAAAYPQLAATLPFAKTLVGAGLLAGLQNDFQQSRQFSEQSLALMQQLHNKPGLMNSFNNLAILAWRQHDYNEYEKWLKKSQAILEELSDQVGLGINLNNLGMLALVQQDYSKAETLFSESLAIRQVLEDKVGQGVCLNNLGILAKNQGNYDQAVQLYTASLALRRELGDLAGIGAVLTNLGILRLVSDDYVQAASFFQESLDLGRRLGDRAKIMLNLNNLGLTAVLQKNYSRARSLYRESLLIAHEQRDVQSIAQILIGLTRLSYEEGLLDQAVYLSILAERHIEGKDFNKELNLSNLQFFQANLADLNKRLQPETLQRIRTQAQSLSFDQLIEYSLEKTL